jgi:hypothetical protein
LTHHFLVDIMEKLTDFRETGASGGNGRICKGRGPFVAGGDQRTEAEIAANGEELVSVIGRLRLKRPNTSAGKMPAEIKFSLRKH